MISKDFVRITFYRFLTNLPVGYFVLITIVNPVIIVSKFGTVEDLFSVYTLELNINSFISLIFSFVLGELFCTIGDIILSEIFNLRLNQPRKPLETKLEFVYPFSGYYTEIYYQTLCKDRKDYCFEMSEIFFSLSRTFMGLALAILIALCIAHLIPVNERKITKVEFASHEFVSTSNLQVIRINGYEIDGKSESFKNENSSCREKNQSKDSTQISVRDFTYRYLIGFILLLFIVSAIICLILKDLNLLQFKFCNIIDIIFLILTLSSILLFASALTNHKLMIITFSGIILMILLSLISIYYRRGANIKLIVSNKS